MVSSFLHVSLSFPPLLNPAHSYTRSKHAILICIEKFAPCASRLNLKRFFWEAGAGQAEDNLTWSRYCNMPPLPSNCFTIGNNKKTAGWYWYCHVLFAPQDIYGGSLSFAFFFLSFPCELNYFFSRHGTNVSYP